ncbi:MAG: acetolactate synthase 1 small subunit [Desulfovibrio sp.]|nr:MAG: acetolactate synthase 1 small subunit [Desulfovibrio sp.]
MPTANPAPHKEDQTAMVQLELTVRNHPGVMSHVCGLFSRRAYNMEGILCMPVQPGLSRMWLLVPEDDRLKQVVTQVSKLHDVLSVERRGAGSDDFQQLEAFFRQPAEAV